MNDGMAETAIISGEVDLARIKLSIEKRGSAKDPHLCRVGRIPRGFRIGSRADSGYAFAPSSYFTERTYGAAPGTF